MSESDDELSGIRSINRLYKSDYITPKIVKYLENNEGFEWNPKKKRWEKYLGYSKSYHGHVDMHIYHDKITMVYGVYDDEKRHKDHYEYGAYHESFTETYNEALGWLDMITFD